jgi:hypothetical protein
MDASSISRRAARGRTGIRRGLPIREFEVITEAARLFVDIVRETRREATARMA